MSPVDAASIPDVTPSTDCLFRAISDRRRREALQCLSDNRVSSLGALSVEVAGRERPDATSPRTAAEPQDVQLTLHHVHLPLLDDAGFVRYDTKNDLITITNDGAAVADWIGDLPGSDGDDHFA